MRLLCSRLKASSPTNSDKSYPEISGRRDSYHLRTHLPAQEVLGPVKSFHRADVNVSLAHMMTAHCVAGVDVGIEQRPEKFVFPMPGFPQQLQVAETLARGVIAPQIQFDCGAGVLTSTLVTKFCGSQTTASNSAGILHREQHQVHVG